MIKTKSVDEACSPKDGFRIFVTRYWPRRHRREECDEWMPCLAPSEKLLKQFQAEKITWRAFEKIYTQEMTRGLVDEKELNPKVGNAGQKYVIRLLKKWSLGQTITLICSCAPDATDCHRHVLARLIEKGA